MDVDGVMRWRLAVPLCNCKVNMVQIYQCLWQSLVIMANNVTFIFFALFLPYSALSADVVLLKDGSVLVGTIEEMSHKKIVLKNFYGSFNINKKVFHKAYLTKSEEQDTKVQNKIKSLKAKGNLMSVTSQSLFVGNLSIAAEGYNDVWLPKYSM